MLAPLGVDAGDDDLLERYARAEADIEAGAYLHYRDVLARSAAVVGRRAGPDLTPAALAAFGGSVGDVAGVPGLARTPSPVCTSASGSPSSPTATTTCSPRRTLAWA